MLRTSLRNEAVRAEKRRLELFLSSNAQDFIEEQKKQAIEEAKATIPEQ